MCVVSMIMDHYGDKWGRIAPQPVPAYPWVVPMVPVAPQPLIPPEDVAEFKRLLERAREYDRKMGEPDCELEEKRKKVKDLAEALGVKVDFL
jgi:hypothetical protein